MANDTTLFVIAYDVQSDKQRTKVHKTLSAYGTWTQFSLFECYLTRMQKIDLLHKLDQLVNPDTDSVRLYPLCQGCLSRVEIIGGVEPSEPTIFLL